jgi:hypothetical protein
MQLMTTLYRSLYTHRSSVTVFTSVLVTEDVPLPIPVPQPQWLTDSSEFEDEVKFTTDSQLVSLSWCLAPIWSLWPDFRFLSDNCGFLDVGHKKVLLGLSRAITLGSKSCRTHRLYFTVSYEIPPTWRARSPYLYPPGTGCPSYTLGHWVPFFAASYGGGILSHLHTGICSLTSNSSCFAADSQLASPSWCRAPIWGPWTHFYYCQKFAVFRFWGGALSLREGRSVTYSYNSLSLSGPSPAEPVTTSVSFGTNRFPFCHLLTTRRATVEVL